MSRAVGTTGRRLFQGEGRGGGKRKESGIWHACAHGNDAEEEEEVDGPFFSLEKSKRGKKWGWGGGGEQQQFNGVNYLHSIWCN